MIGSQDCDTVNIQVIVCSQLGCVLLPVYPVVPHDMQLAIQHSAGTPVVCSAKQVGKLSTLVILAKHEYAHLDSTCMPGWSCSGSVAP